MRVSLKWGFIAWLTLQFLSQLGAVWSERWWSRGQSVLPPAYSVPEMTGLETAVAEPWLRADAHWYLKIAEQGYQDPGSFAFMPAFPMAVRALTSLGLSPVAAAFLLSNICALAGLIFLHSLFSSWTNEQSAQSSVFALALFPTAFFLVAPYAESLLLFAGAAALLLATKSRWTVSAIAAFVASLSRPFGALLVIPLLALALRKGSRDDTRFLPAAGAVGGWVSWMVFVWQAHGDLLGALRIQQVWQRSPRFFLLTLKAGFVEASRWINTELGPYFLIDLAAALVLVALVPVTYLCLRKKQAGTVAAAGVAGYTAMVLISALSYPFAPRPLLSVPRFALAAFPSAVVAGDLPRPVALLLGLVGAAGLLVLSAAFVASRPIF